MREQLGGCLAASQVQHTTDADEYSVLAKIITARQNKNSLSTDPFLSSTTVLPVAYTYLDGCLLLSLFNCVLYSETRGAGEVQMCFLQDNGKSRDL